MRGEGRRVVSAGRSIPGTRPNAINAEAITAPLLPAETMALAPLAFTAWIARLMLDRGFLRTASEGDSSMPTASGVSITSMSSPLVSNLANSASIASRRPVSRSDVW